MRNIETAFPLNGVFLEALKAMNEGLKVTCVVDGGEPVIYKVVDEELTINGRVCDIRGFLFSATQILWGEWTIERQDER